MKIIKIGAMWCPACIITNKFWKQLVDELKDVEVQELDIDMDEDETSRYDNLDILPVIIFEKNGVEISRIVGEHTKEEINNKIKEVLDNEEK